MHRRRSLARRAILPSLAAAMLPVLAVVLTENALRIPASPRRAPSGPGELVEIRAADGVPLRATYLTPSKPNGAAVIVLHGLGDTRRGALGPGAMLTGHGYAVLAPDSRGHGVSGGALVTYGLRETDDVRRWADWLAARGAPELYGYGFSMGAGILLQAAPRDPRFRAVVAEAPFASFREIACDRLGLPGPLPRLLVEPAFLYARLRYGLDMEAASALEALRGASLPVLLIHGTDDANVPARHSRMLAAAYPHAQLWEIPGGGHFGALGERRAEFERRVAGWFRAHARAAARPTVVY
jgi:uncharacterized protein